MIRLINHGGLIRLSGETNGYNAYESLGGSGAASDNGVASGITEFSGQLAQIREALTSNPDTMYLILVLLSILITVPFIIWGARRLNYRRNGPPSMTREKYGRYEWSCVFLMLLLIASDFFAMSNMFNFFGLTPAESLVYSATFAMFLEGFPWVIGRITPLIKDPVQYIRGRKRAYRTLALMCWVGLYMTWALTIVIRILHTYVAENGVDPASFDLGQIAVNGFMAFLRGDYNTGFGYGTSDNDSYLAQVFLFVSPILTSILAYALTLVAFSSNNASRAAKDMQKALEYYQWCEERYQEAVIKCDDAKRSIWASLDGPDESYTDDPANFRKECHVLVHDHLIDECLTAYPGLLKQYNEAVEAALSDFISQCAKHSSEPHKVSRIILDEIISKYESQVTEDINKWHYEDCGPQMLSKLEELLDHTIIMAQFHKASRRKF